MEVHGYGRVDITPNAMGIPADPLSLCALHIPALPMNLFSVQRYCHRSGNLMMLQGPRAFFHDGHRVIHLEAYLHEGLYRVLNAMSNRLFEFQWPFEERSLWMDLVAGSELYDWLW